MAQTPSPNFTAQQVRDIARLARLAPTDDQLSKFARQLEPILDYIAKHRKEIAQADRYPDVRRRSVIELAERCSQSLRPHFQG